jgi:hypothetical protein
MMQKFTDLRCGLAATRRRRGHIYIIEVLSVKTEVKKAIILLLHQTSIKNQIMRVSWGGKKGRTRGIPRENHIFPHHNNWL